MSNDKELARLWKLQTQVNRLILEGKREAVVLLDYYQKLIEQPKWWLDESGLSWLRAGRYDHVSWLDVSYDNPSRRWMRNGGFAGVVSQEIAA